jgi:RNA polymerase sigma-70 factor (ECF subfamily)
VTDEELVARAREGDTAAFGELVLRHKDAVYRAALAAAGAPADADDVAQEAFLLAYTRLRSFRGSASFKTWLLTITWNQAINRRHANNRWWRRIVEIGSAGQVEVAATNAFTASSQTPEQRAAGGELLRDIRDAIARLPYKLRDALLLAQSGEHGYQEMSAMLGAPIGTIKWRVSEARRVVKASLLARGHGDAGRRGAGRPG